MSLNYHLQLSTGSKTYEVDLVSTDKKSESGIVIDGRSYSILGDDSAKALFKEKIKGLHKSDFQNIRAFKAALLTDTGSAQKVDNVRVKVLVSDLSPKQKMSRAVKNIAQSGRGLTEMRAQGVKGRTILPHYYLEITGRRGESMALASEKEALWKADKKSNLSYFEWEEKVTEEWKLSGTDLEIVDWLSHEQYRESGSKESYQDWNLRSLQTRLGIKGSFEDFKKMDTMFRKEAWKKEAPHLSFKEYDRLCELKWAEGSTLSFANWEKYQNWKAQGSPGDFAEWAMNQDYKKDVDSGSTLNFVEWKAEREKKLLDRWEGSGFKATGVSFEDWRLFQDDTALVKAQEFVRLDNNQREIFQLSFSAGTIQRNGVPYNTAYDKTLHSGDGFAIFVIGPKDDFYAGSHIGGVFHHSSFLADGAVKAAGEIKTDEKGNVTYISAKSGHYRPTDEENRLMLKMFQDRGVDLSKVRFSCFVGPGETLEFASAQEYLTHVEKVANERELLRLEMSNGQLRQGADHIADTEIQVALNDMGHIYLGEDLSQTFKINQQNADQTIQPKKPITLIPEEANTMDEIRSTKVRIEKLTKNNQELERLIKKTTKSDRARRPGRQIQLQNNKEAIEKQEKKLTELQNKLQNIRGLGKENVKGGGTITVGPDGKVSKVVAKVGDQQLSDTELQFTLNHLRSKGTDLSHVSLITYDRDGTETVHANALIYLSAMEAYLVATENPHDSHVAVGILRPGGIISEFSLGKNEAYGAHRIGSVTKTFTAFLALKLVNDGMINLETSLGDLIDKRLIDERVLQGVFADPEKARQMTLEQLLSHTSGLDYDDKPRIGPEGEDDPNVRLSTLNKRFTYQATLDEKYEHKHEPGEGIGLYSNLGFDVAAWMLELVYNADKGYSIPQIPFSQIIRDELFTKVFKLSEDTCISPGFSGDGDVIQAGCGDMVSSISDLLKVAQVLQKGEEHLSSYFGEEWQKKMLGARGSDGTYTYGLGCEANASSIQFSGLNYELFEDGIGRDVTAHIALPLQENQPGIVVMSDSNALGPKPNQVKFRQELRKLAGLSVK